MIPDDVRAFLAEIRDWLSGPNNIDVSGAGNVVERIDAMLRKDDAAREAAKGEGN